MATEQQFVIGPTEWINVRTIQSSWCESSWSEWQQEVLAAIRRDFSGVLERVDADDIDWDAWRSLYEQGRSAEAAVASAFGKVD